MTQFFGKYRGKVENDIDPMQLGRVQVSVPAVLGSGSLSWAMPCAPYAGASVGLFAVPPVGSNVWVEFEGGDTDYPIWSGCFWGSGDVPASPALPQMKVLKTDSCIITLNDLPGAGGLTLETTSGMKISMTVTGMTLENGLGAKITLDAGGVEITNGQGAAIKLTGPQVSVNNGALEVL